MSNRQFNRFLVAAIVLIVVALSSGLARAQVPAVTTHPTWVAAAPASGSLIPTWTFTYASSADTTGLAVLKGVRVIECVATTETKWCAYTYDRHYANDIRKWKIFGPTAADTVWTVPAGETRTYTFDKPWVQFIKVVSGTANFSGE